MCEACQFAGACKRPTEATVTKAKPEKEMELKKGNLLLDRGSVSTITNPCNRADYVVPEGGPRPMTCFMEEQFT